MDEVPSSPPNDLSSPETALAWYKAQYETLEHELAEFKASSEELEAELEKDVSDAENRERALQQRAETLGFEVDEWKTKCKQSKIEAGSAQAALQKEITSLRDSNRTLQLNLRDIEVQNDDFERQARNTSSSYEDLESKYNVAIERAVMMEEQMTLGEQEREELRIETQRLRDQLSDLKIEAEIMQEKLSKRQLEALNTDISRSNSPSIDSPSSTTSSPFVMTPVGSHKALSNGIAVSETLAPPSPPMSDASATTTTREPFALKTPMNPPKSKLKLPSGDSSTTPKPAAKRYPTNTASRASRGPPSIPASTTRNRNATPALIRSTRVRAPPTRGVPNSTSLTHIRTLTAQMQRLEQRVQSARSKLPAPIYTPPRVSPRNDSAMGHMPSSVTIRSRKRTGGSAASSTIGGDGSEDTPVTKPVARLSTSGISRLSFGPIPSRDGDSRPSSRASTSSFVRPDRPLSRSEITRTEIVRPSSRTSMSGTRTPLGHYSQSQFVESRRPRSSVGGSYAAAHGGHGHSQSVSGIPDLERDIDGTPSRRGALPPAETSAKPLSRRKSGGLVMTPIARRTSSSAIIRGEERMKPPGRPRKLSGVGET
ncbi:nuclear distribution protein nude [Calycina marina]|uniref:Nuclear distribution protein nude n=1 Tax=Calycina marina TaxID=1763456 RepID=A0A9P7Z0A1_9HELO|nr:nuclear distribution protein nude [Calycina marina]